jgi:uncharacterized OsmC-like protein
MKRTVLLRYPAHQGLYIAEDRASGVSSAPRGRGRERTAEGERMSATDIAAAVGAARMHLQQHPDEARYRDSEAVAVVEDGLAVRVDGTGWSLRTDMTRGVGGGASAASPGWLLRAALASCIATLVSMRAAELGLVLGNLRVAVDSESDDRGLLGGDDDIPAGPLSVRVVVSADAGGGDERMVREAIEWGFAHCPVCDALERPVPVEHVVELR